jgi:hypothetical protein
MAIAGVVGHMPAIKGKAGGIATNTVGIAGGDNDCFSQDELNCSVANMKGHHSSGTPLFHQNL